MEGLFISIFMLVFILIGVILFFYVLIDILRHEFTGYNKIIWLVVLLCLPVLGAILYLAIGKGQKLPK